jgi:hypothetical protein
LSPLVREVDGNTGGSAELTRLLGLWLP